MHVALPRSVVDVLSDSDCSFALLVNLHQYEDQNLQVDVHD